MKNRIPIKKLLFNPFEYIAGFRALIIGLIFIIGATIIDYYIEKSMSTGSDWSLIQQLCWRVGGFILFSVMLFITGVIFSKSKVRFIDVIGTQALARYPNIFASLLTLIPAYKRFINYMLNQIRQREAIADLSVSEIGISLVLYFFMILMGIWTLILMFNAFKVSTNLKGEKSVWIFIITLIVSLVTVLGVKMFILTDL